MPAVDIDTLALDATMTMEARLREPLPEHGCDPQSVRDIALRDVLAPGLRVDHPRFFAYVPGPGNPVAALADALAAGFGIFAGAWQASPGAAMVELVVIDWLRELCGLPARTEGLFLSGGSMANLTALAVALDERAGVERPLPACVVATAGTTGTGAVDPLVELRRVCDEHGLWLHVDGAYGAAAVLCEQGRTALRGLELADSLTLDAHKWLFQPLEAGCLLVRDRAALERTFSVAPAYLRDSAPGTAEVNFYERGPQLTRQFRALKVWMSLKVFGAAAFRAAVEHGLALAEHAEAVLASDPDWEVVTPAQLGIVTFRASAPELAPAALDALNARLPAAALADAFAYLTTTRVDGATVLRLCTINPRTTRADIEQTIARLAVLARAERAALAAG